MERDIYIEYNPYTLKTTILKGSDVPKENSFFNIKDGVRIQEWVEYLPEKLVKEFNKKKFKIEFKGIKMDFADLKFVCDNYKEASFELKHVEGMEIDEKLEIIREISNLIITGPVDELKDGSLINQFEKLRNSELEVNVLATMSSGKSTVLNAILNAEILPSSNRACTALIFKIIDNNDLSYTIKIIDNSGKEIMTYKELEDNKSILEKLRGLNDSDYIRNNSIGQVEIYGNIPFINSSEDTLVLVDTPGPNNANNDEHRIVTQKMIESSNKDVILYIMDGTTLSSNDSNDLLTMISDSMKGKGLQARDRFIFVVNKMDNLQEGESIEEILEETKKLLKRHGIEEPNIFPVSGKVALDLRQVLKANKGKKIDTQYLIQNSEFALLGEIDAFNKRIHLENYSSLNMDPKEMVNKELDIYKEQLDIVNEALIHTGIRSLEEAISIYLNKYFKTAKIKNTSEIVSGVMESLSLENKLKKDIIKNEEIRDMAINNIAAVKKSLENGEKAKELSGKIEEIQCDNEFKLSKKSVVEDFLDWKIKYISENSGKEIKKNVANEEVNRMNTIFQKKETNAILKIEKQIENILVEESNNTIENYKTYLNEISQDLSFEKVDFNMQGILSSNVSIMEGIVISKIIDDKKYLKEECTNIISVENTNRKWYKPWTLFQSKYVDEYIYENVEYVKLEDIILEMIGPIEKSIYNNLDIAIDLGLEKEENLKATYKNHLSLLEDVLIKKLDDYEKLAINKEHVDIELKKLNESKTFIELINSKIKELNKL